MGTRTYVRNCYLCEELLGIQILKTEQTSDWGSNKLTHNQLQYAATDVLHLHKIKEKLDSMLVRENRIKIAKACFDFVEHRTNLDLMGWDDLDIFRH